jgi:hypothetical protein
MKDETSSSANASASSRAQATQAGAALKSSNKGLFSVFAFASAAARSLSQLTDISLTSLKMFRLIVVHAEVSGNSSAHCLLTPIATINHGQRVKR